MTQIKFNPSIKISIPISLEARIAQMHIRSRIIYYIGNSPTGSLSSVSLSEKFVKKAGFANNVRLMLFREILFETGNHDGERIYRLGKRGEDEYRKILVNLSKDRKFVPKKVVRSPEQDEPYLRHFTEKFEALDLGSFKGMRESEIFIIIDNLIKRNLIEVRNDGREGLKFRKKK